MASNVEARWAERLELADVGPTTGGMSMTPKEAGQKIRDSRDKIATVYRECTSTCGTADRLAFDALRGLHPTFARLICCAQEGWVGVLPPTERNVQLFAQGTATHLTEFVAGEVEKALCVEEPTATDARPFDVEFNERAESTDRAAIVLLSTIEKRAAEATSAELKDLAQALQALEGSNPPCATDATIESLESDSASARQVAAEVGAERDELHARLEGLRQAYSTLETELKEARDALAEERETSGHKAVAKAHDYLDKQRVEDGVLTKRVTIIGNMRETLDTAGFKNDDITHALHEVLTALSTAREDHKTASGELIMLRFNQNNIIGAKVAEAVAELNKILDAVDAPNVIVVDRVKWLVDMLQTARAEANAARIAEQVAHTVAKEALAETTASKKCLDAVREALGHARDALVAMAKAVMPSATKPIGVALHDAQNGELVALDIKSEALPLFGFVGTPVAVTASGAVTTEKRGPSEF
jgi:hypothetical protein